MATSTDYYTSQIGGQTVINYAYTDMPWRLLAKDIYYFFVYLGALPRVVTPLRPCDSGHLDELYLSWPNIWSLLVQLLVSAMQLCFLFTLPIVIMLPVWAAVGSLAVFLAVNWALCRLLNGKGDVLHSDSKYAVQKPEHAHEQWIFLNGIATGKHWLRNNVNRLALTFGRPVLGIHNRTSGMLFDVVECLVQRNFSYATGDVRLCFKLVRDFLYDVEKTKVVFILHSQGGIEGGLVLDWLLQELPQDLLSKLEIYTFGNAANHFNNPHRHIMSQNLTQSNPNSALRTLVTETSSLGEVEQDADPDKALQSSPPCPTKQDSAPYIVPSRVLSAAKDRAIGHMEHYAHAKDFVAMWGVLHFATNKMSSPNLPRFLGRLFKRSTGRGGHLFNQHYLDGMFPLKRDAQTGALIGADEDNKFMEETIRVGVEDAAMDQSREALDVSYAGTRGLGAGAGSPEQVGTWTGGNRRRSRQEQETKFKEVKVKDLSRLWSYRNGRMPPDEPLAPPKQHGQGEDLVSQEAT
ncbi:hypothetical protein CDD82_6541 [Ophiocordyceps australis]|uniref:DUF676 domain-containing protein n=1 Tax=Ophiocordyceps australis TaxID=1399860 RepID=A0A2C5YRI6_9HYPO|nr:hypothetical protein CDD82_6541 [Ophiocordyceps australis]